MTFTSPSFFLFLCIVYILYRLSNRNYQNMLILLASYIFYAWCDFRFLFILILSTTMNYMCGLLISEKPLLPNDRKIVSVWLILSCILCTVIDWRNLDNEINNVISEPGVWITISLVILLSILNLQYSTFERIELGKKRKIVFVTSVIMNLGFLCFFKYYNFFIENMERLLNPIVETSTLHLDILLPLGISFYTFKGISYCCDIYRLDIESEDKYINFAAYISFFPAILAGPIDRASKLLKQFAEDRKITFDGTIDGCHLIFYGLFKKIVIADGVFRTVSSVFGSTGFVSWIDVVIGTILFTVQIYCDFSGYTDMARGIAKLFGFELMLNFNLPYFSTNPREFWSRWHISLSTWLRDYLYIPLGGNKHSTLKTYMNLMLTMILGGLWHGAAWNFVLWGFYHGLLLCFHRISNSLKRFDLPNTFWMATAKGLVFFILTCYGWLLFRSNSLENALTLSTTLITDFGNLDVGAMKPKAAALFGIPILIIIEALEYYGKGKLFYKLIPVPAWTPLYASMIFCLSMGMTTESAQFIYINF